MRIGLLVTSHSNFGQNGFYNSQEIGLAQELSKSFDEVVVYKVTSISQNRRKESIDGFSNIEVHLIPSRNAGINGFIDTNELDKTLDVLVYFSDTQLCVPKVYKWTKKNCVKFIPYIGVVESHSDSKVKKIIINCLIQRNIAVYKKCRCIIKTPEVQSVLKKKKVINTTIAPVGLDMSLVKSNYQSYDCNQLKEKWGFSDNEKILLFIGRLVNEKLPLKLINIFNNIHKDDTDYRLLVIGQGILKGEVESAIISKGLERYVKLIDKVPNSEIWELYRMSEAFLNLNKNEIFGMVILEAMYYECPVIAWEAPGPNFIIEDQCSGYLVSHDEDYLLRLKDLKEELKINAHNRVISKFTWKNAANIILQLINHKEEIS